MAFGISRTARQVVGHRFVVSYEEFVEFVRPLGFRCAKDYMTWAKTNQRPTGIIPTRPDCVYRDKGWISWRAALGSASLPYQGSGYSVEELAAIESATEGDFDKRNRSALSYEESLKWFARKAQELAPEYEFYREQGQVLPNLFFRKRDGRCQEPNGQWAALQFKSSARPRGHGDMSVVFSNVHMSPSVGKIFVCNLGEKIRICHQSDLLATVNCAKILQANARVHSLYVRLSDENSDIDGAFQNLRYLWEVLPKRTISGWMNNPLVSNNSHMINKKLASRVNEILYWPAGLRREWSGADEDTVWGEKHNLGLGPYRCVQKIASKCDFENSARANPSIRLSRAIKSVDGDTRQIYTYYDVADGIDFFSCILRAEDNSSSLAGLFFFPRAFLEAHGYLSDRMQERSGMKALPLYVSGSQAAVRRQVFAKEQERFFIDLRRVQENDSHIRNLHEILRTYGGDKTKQLTKPILQCSTTVSSGA
ncbi:unnamed protein product [Amoebophrya sp. A25]|nr:unnamed protein product [Amoebophrya sp. A25]|eukprot:GSA25T00001807001.1